MNHTYSLKEATLSLGLLSSEEFDELVRALRNEALYVNLHSTRWPGGELRAQLGKD